MIPHTTRRGKLALQRLKVFEGIPPPYDKQKRVCVPLAMKILCLRSDRKFCQVGRVAHEVGWQYRDVVSSLEAKRKIKARLHYNHKLRLEVRSNLMIILTTLYNNPHPFLLAETPRQGHTKGLEGNRSAKRCAQEIRIHYVGK